MEFFQSPVMYMCKTFNYMNVELKNFYKESFDTGIVKEVKEVSVLGEKNFFIKNTGIPKSTGKLSYKRHT